MIPAFPKIFTLGDKFSSEIWDGPVEITEKIDGSQFNFGRLQGHVYMCSKGAQIFYEDNNKMFQAAKDFVRSCEDKLPEGIVFHAEYLQKPRHNTLTYERVPRGNIMLFGVTSSIAALCTPAQARWWYAEEFGCEVVPVLFEGGAPENRYEWLMSFVNQESHLGLAQREGIVIKNYAKTAMIGGIPIPLLSAKVVSTEFKEKHKVEWSKGEGKDKLTLIGEAFCAKPRWEKAIQHLRDAGKLTDSPKDIGPLLKEIHTDIDDEERENIKTMLWELFAKDIKRIAVRGFPEYYKDKLTRSLCG
ncbi:MAG TPA: RNA ligase family protein [Candidatus Angelobacter sp.]|nr:RNA ligase family protein [Candidatus Angelobacter sp.]